MQHCCSPVECIWDGRDHTNGGFDNPNRMNYSDNLSRKNASGQGVEGRSINML